MRKLTPPVDIERLRRNLRNYPTGHVWSRANSPFPRPQRLQQRKALICGPGEHWSHAPLLIWVDDDGSCARPGVHVRNDDGSFWWGKTHWYEDEDGKRWAIRCPATLEAEEKLKVIVDDPPGTFRDRILDLKREEEPKSRRGAKSEPEDWR